MKAVRSSWLACGLLVPLLGIGLVAQASVYVETFNVATDPASIPDAGWSLTYDSSNPSSVSAAFASDDAVNVAKLTAVNDIPSALNSGHVFIEHDIAPGESTIDGTMGFQHKGDALLWTTEPLVELGTSLIDLNTATFSVTYQNGNGVVPGHSFMFAFRLASGTWYLLDDTVVPLTSNVASVTTDPIDVQDMTFRRLLPPPGLWPTSDSYPLTTSQLQQVNAVGIYVRLGGELLPSRFDDFILSGHVAVPEPTWPVMAAATGLVLQRRRSREGCRRRLSGGVR